MMRTTIRFPSWLDVARVDDCLSCGRERRIHRDGMCRSCWTHVPRLVAATSPATTCRCVTPHPEPVRLWGTVLVLGAHECSTCGRPVIEP